MNNKHIIRDIITSYEQINEIWGYQSFCTIHTLINEGFITNDIKSLKIQYKIRLASYKEISYYQQIYIDNLYNLNNSNLKKKKMMMKMIVLYMNQ